MKRMLVLGPGLDRTTSSQEGVGNQCSLIPTGARVGLRLALALLCFACFDFTAVADEFKLHTFPRHQLADTYYSEGVSFGDVNNDGLHDVVYGPYWFEGPSFQAKREIYKPVPQPTERYADNFFSWVYDFDGDGWKDVFVVGFPGTPAFIYENPGKARHDTHWPKHEVFDWVSNESPQWTDIVDDSRPELVCTRDGFFGFVTPDWSQPFEKWSFHRVSEQVATPRFGHGLGVGDVNGDGRQDILTANGWYQQPSSLGGIWTFHPTEFARPGGADMFAYDVDGDGDNDVITSLDAHNYGLAWHEQLRDGDDIVFRQHLIMGTKAADNKYGVLFTEPHSVNLVDIDGDGLKDICTGKTYYSHHKQSPMWDAGAVVYWFKLARTDDGVDWIPHKADGESGIGRQLVVGDVNKDGLPDFLAGGMKGCHVLLHETQLVDEPTWRAAQPTPRKEIQAGLSPPDAAKQMSVPAGFHVQLAAGEPLVHQPIAFTTDHRGRIWVAEAYTYPQRAPEGRGKDKIIILEDTDLDGTLDLRKEFITGLNLVSGLEVGFGGVWVGAAPYLMFIPDRDGDDIPDAEPDILLDGFGYQDTHETLNAFIWGPDGWLYGCHGVFTHSRVGTPGTPDEQRVPMNAAVWRYHPTRHEFDVFARGTSNPWGVDFNDRGHAFLTACVIPHLWHVIQGARYQRQGGQHFNAYLYDDIKTIADHSHYTGRIQDSAWWGHEPELSDSVSQAGGGHAHCGAMIYLGDNWPAPYRDSIYFHNIHGNRVNNDLLERNGSGFVGHHGKDFLLANDKWFRGINLKYGPDGSVHLIDWYDKNACHRNTPEIWDRSNGRIYRVSYGEARPQQVDLAKLSSLELAKLQSHDNDWHVRMARRLLQERAALGQDLDDAKTLLTEVLLSDAATPKRLRAMWALQVTGGFGTGEGPDGLRILRAAINDSDENIRAWAIQLGIPTVLPGQQAPEIPQRRVRKLVEMATNDASPLVRLYVASALQRIRENQRWEIAAALLSHEEDADDHNLPLMIWYGIEPLVPMDASRAMTLASTSQIPLVSRFITRRAAADNNSLDTVLSALHDADADIQNMVLDEILNAFAGRVGIPMPESWLATYHLLSKSDDEAIRDKADRIAVLLGDKRILPKLRKLVADENAALPARQEALQVLVEGRDAEAAPALLAALAEPALRSPAIRALAAYEHADTASKLIENYNSFDANQRQDAINTMTSRPSYANALLDAIESQSIPSKDVHAYNIRQLRGFHDPQLLTRIQDVWGAIRESSEDKKQKIAAYKRQLRRPVLARADLGNGRVLFNKTCASCHRLFGEGGEIGPDITGSNRTNLDYILENVVDPNAVVSKDYTMSVLALFDGRVVTGLVLSETDTGITIRTVNDTLVIAKDDVEDRGGSALSLMPEGQLDQLSREEIRDLIGYLQSPSQVPLPRVPAPIDESTGNVPGAIEGEGMQILGKTRGNAASQKMGGFPLDRWSGSDQLWWTGQSTGDRLDLELPVATPGRYHVEFVLTRARDYGVVQLSIDNRPLGGPIDCFIPNGVITTGLLSQELELEKGNRRFTIEVVGKNASAVGHMVGLDFVRLVPTETR